jgi:hypothetical protein
MRWKRGREVVEVNSSKQPEACGLIVVVEIGDGSGVGSELVDIKQLESGE